MFTLCVYTEDVDVEKDGKVMDSNVGKVSETVLIDRFSDSPDM